MQEWQERVVDEFTELNSKLKKLEEFITVNPSFKNANEFEKTRLRDQHMYMTKYSEILHSRIVHFKG
jgi:hypothetical protein